MAFASARYREVDYPELAPASSTPRAHGARAPPRVTRDDGRACALADPWLAAHEHRPSSAGRHLIDGQHQGRHLGGSADEGRFELGRGGRQLCGRTWTRSIHNLTCPFTHLQLECFDEPMHGL